MGERCNTGVEDADREDNFTFRILQNHWRIVNRALSTCAKFSLQNKMWNRREIEIITTSSKSIKNESHPQKFHSSPLKNDSSKMILFFLRWLNFFQGGQLLFLPQPSFQLMETWWFGATCGLDSERIPLWKGLLCMGTLRALESQTTSLPFP